MNILSRGFFENTAACGLFWLAKANAEFKKGDKVSACFSGVMGALFFFGTPVLAAASQSPSCKDGDWWGGNCYPYEKYPHGHLDCWPGSMLIDPLRVEANEKARQHLFFYSQTCVRGINILNDTIGKVVFTCFPNGEVLKDYDYYKDL